jgi:prephenate dehydrogenase
VAIVGLGLIGGSLARSLKATGFAAAVTGYGPRENSLRRGVELGVIDDYSLDLDRALEGAELVVIGAPTLKAAELLGDIVGRVDADTVITDVASVKSNMVSAAPDAANFVPGHPIAGSERSGVEASQADLFLYHRVILTPTGVTDPRALALVRALWESTGAEVIEMDVSLHDRILAGSSHLPHAVAYALVDALARSELSDDIFRYAAGGFRDFTRIASSDPVMWRDIAIANREQLLWAIDEFADHLGSLRQAVADADAEALHRIFSDAKAARDAFVHPGADAVEASD